MLKAVRVFAWVGIVLLTALLFWGFYLVPQAWNGRASVNSANTQPSTIGRPFELVSQWGKTVSDADLVGKPYIVFFGFTNCPDICPTTLGELSVLLEGLGKDAQQLETIFITVDPERDTREVLFQYMSSFDPRILALTGTPEQTAAAVKAFRAYATKVPLDGGGYTMEHTAGAYLISADGNFVGMLDLNEPQENRIGRLRRLINERG
ncbi:hypothetical protein N185_17555 [Sinorhizobium sp. GW3]|nr:hypothetical protein N185_17555 [Sinorhizobium sp. GW3]